MNEAVKMEPEQVPGNSTGIIIRSTIVGLVLCALFVLALKLWMGESGQQLGNDFVRSFGLAGLFTGVLVIDTIPTPGGAIPLMTLCLQAQVSIVSIYLTCLAANFTAGLIGYLLGRAMGLPKRLESFIERKFPGKLGTIREKGVIGVAVLAALPIPMAFATWAGGAFGVSARSVALASLVRIPKLALYLWAISGSIRLLG
jgi:membrane protein YqaA with SNARE-associated domain